MGNAQGAPIGFDPIGFDPIGLDPIGFDPKGFDPKQILHKLSWATTLWPCCGNTHLRPFYFINHPSNSQVTCGNYHLCKSKGSQLTQHGQSGVIDNFLYWQTSPSNSIFFSSPYLGLGETTASKFFVLDWWSSRAPELHKCGIKITNLLS